ncbi:hypothetical protein Fmac_028705 [Flemingia macrophylla]|uniref:Uncharacterized protein n=1 Tax=Flemingia macrophylla TaxID=520843 RepID=A0ABD1L898_9FABA
MEGKLDALMNLVTQLAANQKHAFAARVCGIRSSNDHHTSVCPFHSNLEWMSILRLMLQIPIADHHSRDKALDREYCSQLLAVQLLRIRSLPLLQESATSILPMATILVFVLLHTRHLIEMMGPNSYQFSVRNDTIFIRGLQDVDTNTSAETRKLEGKLDTLVNLVTKLAAN